MNDLTEQAAGAVDALVADVGGSLDGEAVILSRLSWLDGYEAGMKAAKARIAETFAEWQAAQS